MKEMYEKETGRKVVGELGITHPFNLKNIEPGVDTSRVDRPEDMQACESCWTDPCDKCTSCY